MLIDIIFYLLAGIITLFGIATAVIVIIKTVDIAMDLIEEIKFKHFGG